MKSPVSSTRPLYRRAATGSWQAAAGIVLGALLASTGGCSPDASKSAVETSESGSVSSVNPPADTSANDLPGEQRPGFSLPDLDGTQRDIAEWDGDLVVLNFWATWCPPCRKEMPLFQDRYAALQDQGFTVVAVAIDELEITQRFVAEFQLDFPVLIGQSEAMDVTRAYGNAVGALPHTVLIGRDGRILDLHRGEVTEADLDAWIEKHLQPVS